MESGISLSNLKMFRYIDTNPRHSKGGQKLEVMFKYEGVDELIALLSELEIKIIQYDHKPVKPVLTNCMSREKKLAIPRIIRNTYWIENPGHIDVFGEPVFVWCDAEKVSIAISGGPNGVDQELIGSCISIRRTNAVSIDTGYRPCKAIRSACEKSA